MKYCDDSGCKNSEKSAPCYILLRKGTTESAFEKACLQQATLFRDQAQVVEKVFLCFYLVQRLLIEVEDGRIRV